MYTKIVCEVRPLKLGPHCTRITIRGNRTCYPGDVDTPIVSLELIKLIINRFLLRWHAGFIIFDIKKLLLKNAHGAC